MSTLQKISINYDRLEHNTKITIKLLPNRENNQSSTPEYTGYFKNFMVYLSKDNKNNKYEQKLNDLLDKYKVEQDQCYLFCTDKYQDQIKGEASGYVKKASFRIGDIENIYLCVDGPTEQYISYQIGQLEKSLTKKYDSKINSLQTELNKIGTKLNQIIDSMGNSKK